jgi:uncharacterized RDD family membrane protein YckC
MSARMETFKETLTIQTPESVGFQYVLAGVGSRATAFLLDTAIRFVALLSIFILVTLIGALLPKLDVGGIISGISKNSIIALGVLGYGLVDLGYFLFFEAVWSGQTPGKRHQRLRVIRSNGQPIGWLESGIRNILRAVDLLAGFYPLGLIVIFLSRNNQRIGDYAAGTVVVVEEETPSFYDTSPSRDINALAHPEIENYISLVDRSQYRVLKSFLQRRKGMDDRHKHELARMLVLQLLAKWGMPARLKISYEAFLEEVVILYERRKRAI